LHRFESIRALSSFARWLCGAGPLEMEAFSKVVVVDTGDSPMRSSNVNVFGAKRQSEIEGAAEQCPRDFNSRNARREMKPKTLAVRNEGGRGLVFDADPIGHPGCHGTWQLPNARPGHVHLGPQLQLVLRSFDVEAIDLRAFVLTRHRRHQRTLGVDPLCEFFKQFAWWRGE
jgi:hypothetical protein